LLQQQLFQQHLWTIGVALAEGAGYQTANAGPSW